MFDQYANLKLSISEVEEALSTDNMYFAWRHYGHPPSLREALVYFIENRSVPPMVFPFDVHDPDELFV